MMSDNGFIDLRLNAQSGQNQESFWPSFTDIMTVIVMIFMIAMVILLLRNIELVQQLRATMEAQRSAMELARSTGEEKEGLSLRLIAAENELSARRLEQLKLDETNRRQQRTLEHQIDEIAALRSANAALTSKREQLEGEKRILNERLTQSSDSVRSLQEDQLRLQRELASAQDRLASAQRQLSVIQQTVASMQRSQEETQHRYDELDRRFGEQSRELLEARGAVRRSGTQLDLLQGEYDELKVKYNELFKPARTSEGRYLVEVRYYKVGDKPRIEFATEEDGRFIELSREELERRLGALKQAKAQGLYIKVIFPEDSGLTYTEAWKFTSELHARYDYYAQEKSGVLTTPKDSP
ncbi:MAG: hypothetical protein KDI63_16405 [Gammaproteobacteria bacterium]|nr:hypothetical protein [Gammaproteobacteria bacterium]